MQVFTDPTGQILRRGQDFTIGVGDGLVRFPSNWLDLATPNDLKTFGITTTTTPDPPPPPPPVPQIISARQFYQQLAVQSLCTQAEALAAVQIGSVPSALSSLVSALPADQQFGAKMLLCGATTFDRGHPMVAALGQAFFGAKAPTSLDALWAAAALL